jgi:polyhydroxyalkanoate synthase
LAGSGHIAGVINPPAEKPKYGYWTHSENLPEDPYEWLATATENPGSWWPRWSEWASQFGGGKVPARTPGDGALSVIEPAPGSYVKNRAQ